MLNELDNVLIGVLCENNKLTHSEIHKETESMLERSVLRAVILSRLMGLVESGHLELVDVKSEESDIPRYVYSIIHTD